MVRRVLWGLVVCTVLIGCASRGPSSAPPAQAAAAPPFSNEQEKMIACLDLQDHIVDLYARQFVAQEGLDMTPAQKTAFRDGWAEELAKRGTFDRWEQACFYGLTPHRFQCAMQSQTPGGLAACMKLELM